MTSPLVGLLFKWSNRDAGAFIMLIGLIFTIWFFFGVWIVGISGIILLILGLLFIIKPEKS